MAKMTLRDIGKELSAEELRELEAAEKKEAVFDEDSPEMTAEMLMQFKRDNRKKRTKQIVAG